MLAVLSTAAIGLSAFWIVDTSPVYWIWQKLAFVLGGLLLPLELYPDWLRALARIFEQRIGWHRVGVLLSITIISIAAVVLYRKLHNINVGKVLNALTTVEYRDVALAALFVAGGYFTLTFYDLFALRTIGRKDVPYRVAALAGFTSYSVGHNVGASVFTGGAVRYRIYSAWGLDAVEVRIALDARLGQLRRVLAELARLVEFVGDLLRALVETADDRLVCAHAPEDAEHQQEGDEHEKRRISEEPGAGRFTRFFSGGGGESGERQHREVLWLL